MKRRMFLLSSAAISLVPISCKTIAQRSTSKQTVTMRPVLKGAPAAITSQSITSRNQNRSTVVGRNGMAATSQTLAAMAGYDVLKEGGNAIDAAIAMNAVASVTEPTSCGPGGDLFSIVWLEKDQKLYGLNASGRSPYAWNRNEAQRRGVTNYIPTYGPLAWSVPGCVSGWDALNKRFGSMSIDRLLAPAEAAARDGFVVAPIMGSYWRGAPNSFKDFPNAANTFLVDGKAPQYGQVVTNPDMANFFSILRRDGAGAYYHGEIAERIVQYSKERGGLFSLKDFKDHHPDWVEPVSTNYRGYDLWEIPPNGQGIAAIQMMNMLEQFDIASMKPNSIEHIHLFLEAKKLAFEDRSHYYADMEKADVPLEWLISKEYGKERATFIDRNKASVDVKPGSLDGSSDTIYLCAADKHGNMVSLIQSIYYGWGSREVPTGLGFCLQNRGSAFNLDPNHRNTLEPHKRPFHTIIPAFLTKDGKPKCAFGVMGGDFQPQGHAQVLMNIVDFGFSIQQAGDQPRARHSNSSEPSGSVMKNGGSVSLERSFDPNVVLALKALGHNVANVDSGMFGGYQAIWREDGPLRYFAGSDPRKDGCAVGY